MDGMMDGMMGGMNGGMNMIFKTARSSPGGCVVFAHVHDNQDRAPFPRGVVLLLHMKSYI